MKTTAQFRIEEAQFDTEARSTIWQARGIDVQNPATKSFHGRDETAVTIILDVDGNCDYVYADLGGSGDIESLSRFIALLSTVRDGLVAAYSGTERDSGRCFAQGDWGRCSGRSGHETRHSFPDPPKDYPGYEDPAELERTRTEPWTGSPA